MNAPSSTSHFIANNVIASIIHGRLLVDKEFIRLAFINLFNLDDTANFSDEELYVAVEHYKPFFTKACPDLAELNFSRCNRYNFSSYIDRYQEELQGRRWIDFPYSHKDWKIVFRNAMKEQQKPVNVA